MPGMDGYTTVKNMIKLLEENSVIDMPLIVAVTGHVEEDYQKRCLMSGMKMILSKPVNSVTLSYLLLQCNYFIQVPD